MVATNPNQLCKQAEPNYYDFILGAREEPIPQHIVHHIEQCQNCQEQLNRLRAVLSQVDNITLERSQANIAVATILKLHFAYIGEPVTCQTVKPFLPTLLDPVLAVRIPTPITAHIDNCHQCSEDLETIRTLNLNRNQLSRLSQLFAERPSKGKVTCSQAPAAILFVVLMTLRETDADILKHLCTCPDCSKALYEYRQAVCKEVEGEPEQQKFLCEKISAADIFDYVVPYGLDPAKNQYARFRESLCSHVRRCPACLGKMQQLHDTVYAIIDRADSEVATVYNIDDSAKGRATSESNDLYSGFPVKVEVLNCKDKARVEELASTINFPAAAKGKLSSMNLKPLAKVGFAAAAAILIAVALLLNTPTAKGVTIEQIYKAIEKVRNIYVASFVPGKKEPIQEKWVSRALNIYMTKTEDQLVLWNLQNKTRTIRNPDSSSVETTPLSAEMTDEIGTTLTDFLALVPFTNPSLVPKNAGWHQITDLGAELITKDIEVYELTWIEKLNSSNILKKWRVFVNRRTNLPQRTEFYEKLPVNGEYTLRSINLVNYLTDSEIQTVIKDGAF